MSLTGSDLLENHLKSLDLCYFEVSEAFKGLKDEHLWKRPAEALLSVGEIAGHVAYWEAIRFAGEGKNGATRDLQNCKVSSPLLDQRFAYYTTTLETLPSQDHLKMTSAQVLSELLRLHEESMAHLKALDPDLGSPAPHWSPSSNYGELLRYVAFHIAYHTGQIYSVRHLLGEQTPDN